MSTSAPLTGATGSRAVQRVLFVTLLLNLVVAAAKGAYGLWSGSLAIASDAIHSLVDASSNVIGLVVMRFATAPPDRQHPYGHRKLEIVAAAGVGLAIAYAAVRFSISAVEALWQGSTPPQTTAAGFIILAGTLVVNVFVAWWERSEARRLGSAYLAADAAHTGSDILVTLGVLASFAASRWGVSWADPVGAILVIVVIGYVAWSILQENISILIDRAAVDTERIATLTRGVAGVRGCHRIRSRGVDGAVHIDLHLLLDGSMSLNRAHDIAHKVEDTLRREIPTIADVTIHMEPEDDGHEGL